MARDPETGRDLTRLFSRLDLTTENVVRGQCWVTTTREVVPTATLRRVSRGFPRAELAGLG